LCIWWKGFVEQAGVGKSPKNDLNEIKIITEKSDLLLKM